MPSIPGLDALWNDSVAYTAYDVVTYDNSDWVTLGEHDSVDREQLAKVVQEMFVRTMARSSQQPAPTPAPELCHVERVFPFEEV
jgi:hypothetical protein